MDVSSVDHGPYVGARPYGSEDRNRFFGRSQEAEDLAGTWLRSRVTILHGDCGVGKTSLLQAGVMPLLMSRDAVLMPVGRVSYRSTFPSASLPEQNPYTFALLSSWSPADSPTRISGLTINDFLRRHAATGRSGRRLPMLVVIDQAERIFRAAEGRRRWCHRFVHQFADALRSHLQVRLLISVRTDHLDAVLAAAAMLGDVPPARFHLGALSPDAATEAVTRPAERKGRSFEPDAARRVVDELRTVGPAGERAVSVEPVLLQAACTALWGVLPGDTSTISRAMVEQYGQVDRALTGFCAQAMTETAGAHLVPFHRLHSWLRDAAASGGRAGGLPGTVLRALEDQHLIKARPDGGYQLLHDRLAEPIRHLAGESWPAARPSAAAYLRAAELALSDDEYDLAQRQAEAVIHASHGGDVRIRADAQSLLGNIAYAREDLDDAVRHYQVAAELYELLQDTRSVGRLLAAVGRIKLSQGQRAVAVEQLSAAVNRLPNDPAVQTGLGQALWYAGQTQAALGVLTGVLTREGDTPIALQARGEIMADLGDAESALRDLNRVDHAEPSARAARALALARLSHFEAARKELDDIIDDDNGPVLLRAALVQELGGDADAAAALAEQALVARHPPLISRQRAEAHRVLEAR